MIDVHLKKVLRRDDLTAQEQQAVRDLVASTMRVAADKIVVRAGVPLKESMILLEGWAARAKDLPSGSEPRK